MGRAGRRGAPFVNDLERPIGTYLYGRRMYEVMAVWETPSEFPDPSPETLDYAAIWHAADKVVYSTTLGAASTPRTRIERAFDQDAVRQMKASATRRHLDWWPRPRGSAIEAGLVDEWHLFVNPIVVGGGTPWLPDDVRVPLELLDEHRFANGVVHLHYRTTT